MANYFPIEFLGIFIVFYVTYKLKLQKYIISFLFRRQVIYLPLTDNDFEQLMQLSKEYKDNKKQGKVLIRSCEFKEYSEKSQSIRYIDFDFLVYLYSCNFIVTFFSIIYKLLYLLILGHEKTPFLLNENNKNNSEISIKDVDFNLYLTVSFIIYIIYRELKKYIFFFSFTSKAVKQFYICFILSFGLFFLNEYYNEKLFNLNYDAACQIINNRINLILTQSNANFNFDVEIIHVKILFSFIFGLISGIFLRATERGAYFDNFFCNVSNTSQLSQSNSPSALYENQQEKSEIKLEYMSKIKSIINLMVIALIFEPLLDNFLEIVNLSNYILKLIIIFVALVIEFVFGFYIIWYAYYMYSVQNYQEIMKFVKKPNSQYLKYHKNSVNFINENAWDVISHVFINCFVPFYVLISYFNQINIFSKIRKINDNNVSLNKGFLDNILFIIFLSFQFSKGVVENVIFYYRLITNEKHLSIF